VSAAEAERAHDDKLRALGQLISGVAHELANPLTVIAARAVLIRSAATLEAARAHAGIIEAQVERATHIVRNLSSFTRRRAGGRAPASLNDVVRSVLELHGYQLAASRIEVGLDLQPDLPLVSGDAYELEQVVLNLVLNAQHAMAQAHGRGRLTLRTGAERGAVRLAVADDGPGIPREILPQVFKPFFSTKGEGGSGLGLAIVQELVHRHDGHIEVDTRPGAGTTVTLSFPRWTGRAPDASSEAPAGTRAAAPGAVLVVEDEQEIGQLIAMVVQSLGYEAEHVPSARAALDRVRARPCRAIVTDIRMPDMDGAELWRELCREDPALARRTIFMTGDHAKPETAALLESLTQPVLTKPFRWEELTAALGAIERAGA
jgi:two-component system NtrC family sensor kinase